MKYVSSPATRRRCAPSKGSSSRSCTREAPVAARCDNVMAEQLLEME
jgi:hypothetical protein